MAETITGAMGTTEGNNQQQMTANIDRSLVMEIMEKFTKNKSSDEELMELIDYDETALKEKGNNFLSQISVLTVNYRLKTSGDAVQTISFIVKRKLNIDVVNQLEDACKIFQREVQFYKEISNGFNIILQSANEDFTIAPSCLCIRDDMLILENLHRLHYKLQDVKQGLNLLQLQIVMQHLAKFHALGMKLYLTNPEMFRLHLTGSIAEYSIYHDMYRKSFATCIKYCSKQKDLHFYTKHLESFQTKILLEMKKAFTRNTKKDRYYVLNHGDMWVNNLLFNDEQYINPDKNNSKVLFIDFQEGYFGSPGIDLNYLIFTSCRVEVFQNHLNDLLNIYHETLKDFLQKINYSHDAPTKHDVQKEFLNKGAHGLATATCVLPLLITEHAALVSADIFQEDNYLTLANRRLIFDNPSYAERLKVFLKYFVDNNIL